MFHLLSNAIQALSLVPDLQPRNLLQADDAHPLLYRPEALPRPRNAGHSSGTPSGDAPPADKQAPDGDDPAPEWDRSLNRSDPGLNLDTRFVQNRCAFVGATPRIVSRTTSRTGPTAHRAVVTRQPVDETAASEPIAYVVEIRRATQRKLGYIGAALLGCMTPIAMAPFLPWTFSLTTPLMVASALGLLAAKSAGDATALLDLEVFLTKPGSRAQYHDWLRRQPTDGLMEVCLSRFQIETLVHVSRGSAAGEECPFIRQTLRPLLVDVLANERDPVHLASDIAWLRADVFDGLNSAHSVADYKNRIAFGKRALHARRKARACE